MNSPGRFRSYAAEPDSPNTSKPSPLGRPCATLEIEKVPTEPLANLAVKVAMSSLSTASVSSPTSPPAWPTVMPTGTGRSVVNVWKTAPLTLVIGPQMYSPRSIMWLPMSASAPLPGPPR